ncbi:ASCH domain-containing protein [Nocardiopsis gilva YIM 90087]|uniref:ASCH domain-containing protein n=1 Tax=Nocardiopsis gilva YIM 90087 TaxID=1235441 RepID=A0A223S198_9ACTN|nr:ASCH domain-containing protein [Nocardiopsis gilva]ASU81898.1 ASCH domain-containing protein [Nocardiopsis gilva YIM 90087]
MSFASTMRFALASLPTAEFGFPGPMRDRLVAAILDGRKTGTTALLAAYEGAGEQPPQTGDQALLVDSAGRSVAVIETTDMRVVPLHEVDEAHVAAEGEGHGTVAEWRAAHEEFWHSAQMRAELGDPDFTVDDATEVVLERFRVQAVLRDGS